MPSGAKVGFCRDNLLAAVRRGQANAAVIVIIRGILHLHEPHKKSPKDADSFLCLNFEPNKDRERSFSCLNLGLLTPRGRQFSSICPLGLVCWISYPPMVTLINPTSHPFHGQHAPCGSTVSLQRVSVDVSM